MRKFGQRLSSPVTLVLCTALSCLPCAVASVAISLILERRKGITRLHLQMQQALADILTGLILSV